jgi:hypothetical protein
VNLHSEHSPAYHLIWGSFWGRYHYEHVYDDGRGRRLADWVVRQFGLAESLAPELWRDGWNDVQDHGLVRAHELAEERRLDAREAYRRRSKQARRGRPRSRKAVAPGRVAMPAELVQLVEPTAARPRAKVLKWRPPKPIVLPPSPRSVEVLGPPPVETPWWTSPDHPAWDYNVEWLGVCAVNMLHRAGIYRVWQLLRSTPESILAMVGQRNLSDILQTLNARKLGLWGGLGLEKWGGSTVDRPPSLLRFEQKGQTTILLDHKGDQNQMAGTPMTGTSHPAPPTGSHPTVAPTASGGVTVPTPADLHKQVASTEASANKTDSKTQLFSDGIAFANGYTRDGSQAHTDNNPGLLTADYDPAGATFPKDGATILYPDIDTGIKALNKFSQTIQSSSAKSPAPAGSGPKLPFTGDMTVEEFAKAYAPANADAWLKRFTDYTGATPDQKLSDVGA